MIESLYRFAQSTAMAEGDLVVRDLHVDYDRALLVRFYEDMMVPNFGQFEDELEPVDVWTQSMEQPETNPYTLHVILLFGPGSSKIAGGVACEYYPKSNCGLLTYIAVDTEWRQKSLGRVLVREVLKALHADARKAGKAACDAVFLETNSDNVAQEKDVMVPAVRRRVLHKLGFRILRFRYVQPALAPGLGKCTDLLLTVHESFLGPVPAGDAAVAGVLKSQPLLHFMREFFEVLMGAESLTTDPDYLQTERELAGVEVVLAEA
eukprot:Unigene3522_Nuclearia_a/m.10756 Unigene3522_Nuclearia_a/g.10756  ORF Unigene3522_Nuclearia_a/g.10756 Unigene3522_Nuclearia_a/m.10756 type:complete len:264 (-) Unigene3522_Nuclearia_a:63-854(-)